MLLYFSYTCLMEILQYKIWYGKFLYKNRYCSKKVTKTITIFDMDNACNCKLIAFVYY